jgi:hypothetical protein
MIAIALLFVRFLCDCFKSSRRLEAKEREPSKVINLMDALRRSVETERRTPARSTHRHTPKKAGRSSARHKKAGYVLTREFRQSCQAIWRGWAAWKDGVLRAATIAAS